MKFQEINPFILSQENAELLFSLFSSNKLQKFWYKDEKYTLSSKNSVISLECDVIFIGANSGTFQFEILHESLIGEGAQGIICPVVSVLYRMDGAKYSGEYLSHKRVLKQQEYNYISCNEFKMSLKVPHLALYPLHMKSAKRSGGDLLSFMLIKKMPGIDLFSILDRSSSDYKPLNIEQKFMLTKQLLLALQHQVFNNKLEHRDLKPENIMVDLSSKPFKVNIIDFALSCPIGSVPEFQGGTVDYMPPEKNSRNYQKASTKGDVYSMAIVLNDVWSNFLENNQPKEFQSKKFRKDLYQEFYVSTQLTLKNLESIYKVISKMAHSHPEKRLTVSNALCAFDKIERTVFSDKKAQNFTYEQNEKISNKVTSSVNKKSYGLSSLFSRFFSTRPSGSVKKTHKEALSLKKIEKNSDVVKVMVRQGIWNSQELAGVANQSASLADSDQTTAATYFCSSIG